MKRYIYLILCLIMFVTCYIAISVIYGYGEYDLSGDFSEIIESNPIDVAYDKELNEMSETNLTTQSWVELEAKYANIWDSELNAIYKKLLLVLNKDEQEILRESQRGWLQYHKNEPEFVKKVFYERKSGPIFGSQGRVQMIQAIKNRIRTRTLELLEYYYMLEGKVPFVYKAPQKK